MGAFRQLGDPVCPDCLCQHHEEALAKWTPPAVAELINSFYEDMADGATIVQVQITTTETCCIVVNAAVNSDFNMIAANLEIERPLGTIRTTQEDKVNSGSVRLTHHAGWEVLPAGTYTYFLVNRSGAARRILCAWIKAVASDCLG